MLMISDVPDSVPKGWLRGGVGSGGIYSDVTALNSSASAGRGSEGRRGGGGQSGSTQRCHKVSLIVLRSGQRAA